MIRQSREVARRNGSTAALVLPRIVRSATALRSRVARIMPDDGAQGGFDRIALRQVQVTAPARFHLTRSPLFGVT